MQEPRYRPGRKEPEEDPNGNVPRLPPMFDNPRTHGNRFN
jgi:hypothetical protein